MGSDEPGTFSLRYGLRPRPAGLVYDSVPERARVGLVHIVHWCKSDIFMPQLYEQATWALRLKRRASAVTEAQYALHELEQMFSTCEWWAFYDLCEVVAEHLRRRSTKDFEATANQLFREECLGWQLKEGLVERVGTEQSQRLVDEARRWLSDAKFAGPEEQFGKALRFLSARPQPDTANCVKDAVGALEGVARIATGRHSALLSQIVAELKRNRVIPPTLAKCFEGLYAYRGDAEAVGHGAVTGVPLPLAEAEAALNMSASLIIYLANKAGGGKL